MFSKSVRRVRTVVGAVALGSALFAAAAVNADIVGDGFLIIATDQSSGESASYTANVTWDGQAWSWASSDPIELRDPSNNDLLGTINPVGDPLGSSIQYYQDPVVAMNFSVQAGSSTTTFMVGSALLSFPTINGAEAVASAAFSVTDPIGDGAVLTGIGDPAGTQGGYLAQYNGFAGTIAGTTFAELQQSVVAAPFSTNTVTQSFPGGSGMAPIGDPVSDMSTLVSFTLSPFDLASGTTSFSIVPEPASVVLLALGFCLVRRR